MAFITDQFLLHSGAARHLYETYAAGQPILDFHCHLSPKDIAENRRFENLYEIWLEGDHYKWRAMRLNGVDERYCTGDAAPYEKFMAWARTVPHTLRNPLHHWTHLELKRYFGIDDLLDETTAPRIWKRACDFLAREDFSARGILKKFRVAAVCTTDDPTDPLTYHRQIQGSRFGTLVFPAFRPDRALQTKDPAAFNEWTNRLGAAASVDVSSFPSFLDALQKRHEFFHQQGCRLSDHGLDSCPVEDCTEGEAEAIFDRVRSGTAVSARECAQFASFLLLFFGRLDAEKGWAKQLHLGAYRNANSRMFKSLGKDTGFDAIGDWPQVAALTTYLDRLDSDHRLPKMILLNLNPADTYLFAAMMATFQNGKIPGKLQLGSAWWFLDQKEGIEWQINAISNCGLLSRFVGMVTDSRSFMSFPRHEYFRRVLCNLLGSEIEAGLLPENEGLVGALVRNICFDNAAAYLGLPQVEPRAESSASVLSVRRT